MVRSHGMNIVTLLFLVLVKMKLIKMMLLLWLILVVVYWWKVILVQVDLVVVLVLLPRSTQMVSGAWFKAILLCHIFLSFSFICLQIEVGDVFIPGSNMSCTPEAIDVLKKAKVIIAPAKAASAGGVSLIVLNIFFHKKSSISSKCAFSLHTFRVHLV